MPLSVWELFSGAGDRPLLLLIVVLTLVVLFVNGWTDAPNAIAGVVASGTLPFRRAARLAALFNLLGMLCMTALHTAIAETIFSVASFSGEANKATAALCAAMTAIILWACAAWWFGIPTSESHALVAGISGAAIALEGSMSCIRTDSWKRILLGLILSVFGGFLSGLFLRKSFLHIKLSSIATKTSQIFCSASSAFLHGAQDGQKFLGVCLLGISLARGGSGTALPPIPLRLIVLCAGCMALGTRLGGKRIIDTIGRDMVRLHPKDALAADLASIACLTLVTVLGLPASTSHAKTASLLGAGLAGTGYADGKIARQVLTAWLLTFPCCAAIGFWMTKLFLLLTQSSAFP